MEEKQHPTKPTATAVENMKRAAKAMHKDEGIKHGAALELVAKAHGYACWRDVTMAAAIHTAATDPMVRRPEMSRVMADVHAEHPTWSTDRVLAESKHRCTGPGRVAPAPHPTPRPGPPPIEGRGGNSTPAAANVRGSQKSERSGERTLLEVNARGSARGVE